MIQSLKFQNLLKSNIIGCMYLKFKLLLNSLFSNLKISIYLDFLFNSICKILKYDLIRNFILDFKKKNIKIGLQIIEKKGILQMIKSSVVCNHYASDGAR